MNGGRRDLHRFDAGGQPFVCLVPSATTLRLDEPSAAAIGVLEEGPMDVLLRAQRRSRGGPDKVCAVG